MALNDEKNAQDYAVLELKLADAENRLAIVRKQRDEEKTWKEEAHATRKREGVADKKSIEYYNDLAECYRKAGETLVTQVTAQRHFKEAAHRHHKKEMKKVKRFGANNKVMVENNIAENEALKKGIKIALRAQVMSLRNQVNQLGNLGLDVNGVDYV